MTTKFKQKSEELYQELLKLVEWDVGVDITNTLKLNDYAKDTIPGFIGTFSKTKGLRAIRDLSDRQCMILNTIDYPGEHWCAAYKFGTKTLFYDSFGRPFNKLYSKSLSGLENTEDDAEQDDDEENCGARCLAWLLVCVHGGFRAAKNI